MLGTEIIRSEEHTSELQSLVNLVCRLLLEKKKKIKKKEKKRKKKEEKTEKKGEKRIHITTVKTQITTKCDDSRLAMCNTT